MLDARDVLVGFFYSSHELRSPLHHENEARRPLESLPLLPPFDWAQDRLPATGEGQDGGDFLSSLNGSAFSRARLLARRSACLG